MHTFLDKKMDDPTTPPEPTKPVSSAVRRTVIQQEMQKSYMEYAMSVIVSRALPDVRDGLKPVHRRILFGMHDLGMFHNKPFKKSARIVGDVMGKYHPHGDSAIYDTIVRMAQEFSMRHTLVSGQGNFGSIDGDKAAAMRYTESRLSKISEELLKDIEKDTVDFNPNFDASLKEPSVLPSKFPNLLVNGASGIAVGMATNVPPHNLREVCAATITLIKNPDATVDDIAKHIIGPDFPTGGIILGRSGIRDSQMYGRGRIRVRARYFIEEQGERSALIFTEIPYMVNKSMMLEQIADLVRSKIITDIADLRDESDREGMRIVVLLKKNANAEVVANQLFKHSRLQVTHGANMLALVDREPKTLNYLQMLQEFLKHRQIVVRRRTQFELEKAKRQEHILAGLIIALDDIDRAIKLIKESRSAETAMAVLRSTYTLTEVQAKAILEMRLQRLTNLEQDKIRSEQDRLLTLIGELTEILADTQKILDIICQELAEISENYGDDRRTDISDIDDDGSDLDIENLIPESQMVVTVSHAGYVKRLPLDTYKQQHRGGRGVIAAGTKDEDFIEQLFVTSTHSYLLCFTESGQVHWVKVYQLPEVTRQSMGTAIVNLIGTQEKVSAILPIRMFEEGDFVIMATKNGTVKRISLQQFSRPRRGGIRAITLEDEDTLVTALHTDGNQELLIATALGNAVRCKESDFRPIGRAGRGVRGVSLGTKDELIGLVKSIPGCSLLTITQNGYGKRTVVEDYRLINRGGKGVINIKCSERNGSVAGVACVQDNDDVMLISHNGIIIRTHVAGISSIGRNTQGVRLMKLSASDKIVALAKVVNDDDEIEVPDEDFAPRVNRSNPDLTLLPTAELDLPDEALGPTAGLPDGSKPISIFPSGLAKTVIEPIVTTEPNTNPNTNPNNEPSTDSNAKLYRKGNDDLDRASQTVTTDESRQLSESAEKKE